MPSEWKPIETAPMDGSIIMLANAGGSWMGKYHPVFQSGYRPENPWFSLLLNHDHVRGRAKLPSHWMPLPEPPEESHESA